MNVDRRKWVQRPKPDKYQHFPEQQTEHYCEQGKSQEEKKYQTAQNFK
jgi:hypothetical protein